MATPAALAKKAARDMAATLAAVEVQAAKLDALQIAVAELSDAIRTLAEQTKPAPAARRSTKK